MFNSLVISYHLIWLLSRSVAIHAVPRPIYYYVSDQCRQRDIFQYEDAEEALDFTRAAIRRDTANFQSTLQDPYLSRPRQIADPNQANIFFWVYNKLINSRSFATILDQREQMLQYEESYDRDESTIRIECDNDHLDTVTPPGRWMRVNSIPFSPDQYPNPPIRNWLRTAGNIRPGGVVEYFDVANKMRETDRSNFCTSNPTAAAVLHMTPARGYPGQIEPRYVITICDTVLRVPPNARSMDAFLDSYPAGHSRNAAFSVASFYSFTGFRSLLFLYMLYQLPPLRKQPTASLNNNAVGLGDLASIFALGDRRAANHAGAFAWYDLLAGFADQGYVFTRSAGLQIDQIRGQPGYRPDSLRPALFGALTYDMRYLYNPNE